MNMKRRVLGVLLSLVMMMGLLVVPATQANAATEGVTDLMTKKTYNLTKLDKDYLYVCDKKIDMSNIPIVMRNGAYMGAVAKIFKNSDLNVAITDINDNGVGVMKLTYGNKVLTIREGSRNAILNGADTTLAAAPFRAYYVRKAVTRWVVPLWSVCSKLGISYTRTADGVIKIGKAASNATDTDKKKIVICIDAGHGGSDSGAVANGLREKDLTLKIVMAAKKYFDANSRFKVYYTRVTDTYPSLLDRSALANSKSADFFLCCHINYYTNMAHGTETMYNPARCTVTKKNGITSYQLANAMQIATVNATGFTNRGLVERTGLSVLNRTNMPACLIEYGFISHPTEAISMKNNTDKYGRALYNAMVTFCKNKGLY